MIHRLKSNEVWYVFMGAVIGSSMVTAAQNYLASSVLTELAALGDRLLEATEAFEDWSGAPALTRGKLDLAPIEIEFGKQAALQRINLTVQSGDTLLGLLRKHRVSAAEAHIISQAMIGTFDPSDIRVGQQINITMTKERGTAATAIDALTIKVSPGYDVIVVRTSKKAFGAHSVIANSRIEPQALRGTIRSSLYQAALDQGVPFQTLDEMIRLFSYDVDFQRDIRVDDKFEIMFNRRVTENGVVVAYGAIEYASMTLNGTTQKIYAYEHENGLIDHYNEFGEGTRKALMRTPINGARLSSSYGRRQHPILGYNIMHRGVDFAAPRGTPVYAAGDGIIEKRFRRSGYGNYIRILHGEGFSTAYAHMRNFANGFSVGSRVKQGDVIGYVGSTGRSTGPHLHFEIHRNGTIMNPMKVRIPASKILEGKERSEFQAYRAALDKRWERLSKTHSLAFLQDENQKRPVK